MAAKETFTVYKLVSPNGKSYIGQTNWLEKRFSVHRNSKTRTYLSMAIQKYGFDNFTKTILHEGLAIDESNYYEAKYIEELNTLFPNGYNLRTGGDNSIPCETTRQRMSVAQKARQPFPEAHRKAISEKAKGRSVSDTHRENLSKALSGKKKSAEHCLKNGLAKKGIKQSPEHVAKRVATNKANKLRKLAEQVNGNSNEI